MPLDVLSREDFAPRGLDTAARRLADKAVVTRAQLEALTDLQRRAVFGFSEVHKARVLQRLRDSIAAALRNGTSYRDVRRELLRILTDAGYDSVPFYRIRFMFSHHASRSMAESQKELLDQDYMVAAFPYREYLVVQSPGHRQTHEDLAGVYRADDPFWARYNPPWEFGCKCYTVPRSQAWVDRNGVTVRNGGEYVADKGIAPGPSSLRIGEDEPDLEGLDADLREAVQQRLR